MSAQCLYNGVVFPEKLPEYPQEVFKERKCLAVPYLDDPPEVIKTGTGRELFVDDFIIESTDCKKTFHYPEKYAGNPILKPETQLELGNGEHASCACPKSGGVWYDYEKRIYRMWYEAGFLGYICYAESTDGINWIRPDLDVFPGTNRVLPFGLKSDSWTVIHDYYTTDPQQKFKLFVMEPCYPAARGMVMTSPDGIHWSLPTATGFAGDRTTMFFNPFRKKWCFSLRSYAHDPMLRMRDYAEGDDIFTAAQWGALAAENHEKTAVHWAGVDELDAPDPNLNIPPQLYNLDAVPYESLMLGMFQLHYGPPNKDCEESGYPKITGLEFAYSRDGFHWSRPDRKCAIYPEPDTWNRGYVQSLGNICTVSEDKITFYFTGFGGNPGGGLRHSMYENGATGIAFLRRDGFASMDAGENGGMITTRKLTFDGKYLFVNIDAQHGEVRAEVLDEQGRLINGFSADDCLAVSGDHTKIMLRWRNAGLETLQGKAVKFRFILRNAGIYSFWVSRSLRGESRGYVSGGGPDYHAPIDL